MGVYQLILIKQINGWIKELGGMSSGEIAIMPQIDSQHGVQWNPVVKAWGIAAT